VSDVAIVGGTGALGTGLARRLAVAGVRVALGSRDGSRAAAAAAELDDLALVPVTGGGNAEVAASARIVIVTVPFAAHAQTLADIAPVLTADHVLVDATVPLAATVGGRATRMLGVWQGSAAEQAREIVADDVPVVAALHSVAAAALADLEHDLDEDVLVCGDGGAAKREVAALIGRIDGLRPVNAGRLDAARIAESMTALMIGMNGRYRTQAGLKVTGLPEELWPVPATKPAAVAV
jgi:8-hydroxy-5-deazaflavin:NADPH oxidoreductase